MLMNLSPERLATLKNPSLQEYGQIYLKIADSFNEWVNQTGLVFDKDISEETSTILQRLQSKGALFRNEGKSIYVNQISPACVACQKGVGSVSLFISLICHRDCYFCFNKNQDNYELFSKHKRNYRQELDTLHHNGGKLVHLGLTGGEPLLHKAETVDFFQHAKAKFPRVYTRLYTSGDLADEDVLKELQETHLDEIRFSIKVDDPQTLQHDIFQTIALAKDYIPTVMVEMPVIPGTFDTMKDLLLKLDSIGIFGINLLEFCFPFNNAEVFKRNKFKVKNPPYRVLYDYWYAGGLPISRSELECLQLLEFILDQKLTLGAQYCSLENKHTAQIYQQNHDQRVSKTLYFSNKDYFYKSAKVFGADIPKVLKVFKKLHNTNYVMNDDYQFLEFHVEKIKNLTKLDIEIGISYNVMEKRGDGSYLRELRIDVTSPKNFDLRSDI
ncbi:radical SAM protein [Desulfosporosinus shakirovi]|uniref:radical SAM protein n=1 Tax=Desulfosporosinus shakirovi TaxID=2885154 RepID=UPI001E30E3F4|nr:radical SAM protein [Desulfosporosinus sp. SRJS8]MCB8814993.1 radical SAM protein [Desulfosporosinus sp. SRJS8]